MKQNITLAYNADGTSGLIHGTEVPEREQRATVQGFRDNGVPEGVERVEMWTRTCVKFAYRKPAPAPAEPPPVAPEVEVKPPAGSKAAK